MNTKTAAILVSKLSMFDQMQAAELAWWKNFAKGSTARHRMYALYGMRYEWFWREMQSMGSVVEFGSGPMPAMLMGRADSYLAVDTLFEAYQNAGIVDGGIPWAASANNAPTASFNTVLMLNVLDHTDDPAALVRQAYRVLYPGGKALVFVHLENEDDKHRRTSMPEVFSWLTDAGFTIKSQWLKPANDYDPQAFLAVAEK